MNRTKPVSSGPYDHTAGHMAESGNGVGPGVTHDSGSGNKAGSARPVFSSVVPGARGGGRMALVLCLVLAACLCSCAPREQRPLTFEEQQDIEAYRQCRREATAMNPEWRGDTSYFPWRAYFNMCMRRMGVSEESMRRMRM
ncbi:hypothetical protein [Desulfovibrio sp.]|uniref:hypothetical protein n=1 Tax=Desulfovibrio sp. TaxID=885 RepID=UPI0025C578E4|nr:hypothetical protein [Desulfovibrio sp.]